LRENIKQAIGCNIQRFKTAAVYKHLQCCMQGQDKAEMHCILNMLQAMHRCFFTFFKLYSNHLHVTSCH